MKTNHIKIKLPKQKIADFCRRHHIRKLAVFGSALREDFRPDAGALAVYIRISAEVVVNENVTGEARVFSVAYDHTAPGRGA